ncbi:MAG: NAD(P)-dependent oxidoreductase [Gammaproteobacteria bacterium]|nr:NAD(P)-dependent oxidoreductase [Gammaproteobacteria bacterium]
MYRKVFLAGASGVIGKRLVPLLLEAGYEVFGTTRSAVKAEELKLAGVKPIIVDVFDSSALSRSMAAVSPDIVIHQLTDLPPGLDPSRMAEALVRNARIRSEGTQNLLTAACKAGARRLIAQSIAWVYAPGQEPHSEADPLDIQAEGVRAISVQGVATLERLTLHSPPLEGIVLRYGHLYGPGTGANMSPDSVPLHVDAAAWAALLAIEKGRAGIFNIAETNPYVATTKARHELGWEAGFRLGA